MEKLRLKYEVATKALKSLQIMIVWIERDVPSFDFSKVDPEDENFKVWRDSLIQRFEYSVDTVWKYLKEYLWRKRGVEQTHPKPVFRECFKVGLINEQETEKLIDMIDDRNITSHAYKESIANKVGINIPIYYKLMKKLLDEAQP